MKVPAFLIVLVISAAWWFDATAEELQARRVMRDDGTTISYYLGGSSGPRQDAILVLQGTGCVDVSQGDARAKFERAARLISPRSRMLLINNYGVPDDSGPLIEGCPRLFWERATLHQRVFDVLHVVADLRRASWWTGRIVIFGGSEGGAVASLVAPLVPEASAVIVYSSGTGATVSDLIRQALPPQLAAESHDAIRAAKATPVGDIRWVGLSYAWWADAADVMPARSLAWARAPVLLVHGALDTSSPVATARAGRDFLAERGKRDVTYLEFPSYDHVMKDRDGKDHSEAVMTRVADWLEGLPR